jgi:NAD(P)-dependent dehydrogenase (short-subunit alcohol dehydrogenase family)
LALLGAGYRVACGYNHNRAGAEQIAKGTRRLIAVKIDIASRASVKRALAAIGKHFGRGFDIVVNNAALVQENLSRPSPTPTGTACWRSICAAPSSWRRNPCPPCCAQMGPHHQHHIHRRAVGRHAPGPLCRGQGGLINLTHSLASSIPARASPPTPLRRAGATGMIAKELKSKAGKRKAAQIPVGRIAMPDEIAAGVVYLASDAAGYVTGHTLNINGGLLMS